MKQQPHSHPQGPMYPGGTVSSSQIDEFAVTQYESALSLLFTQLTDQIADAQVPASAVTQHEAALSIAWGQITGEPTTIGGYGITDFNSLGDARWSLLAHTHAFADLTSKPTTVGGYGITDFNSLGDARWSLLAHTHAFADLTSKPTTVGGYGITDLNSLGDARWNPLATGTPDGTKFLRDDNVWTLPPSGAVSSVFTRTGAVVAAANDYTFAQLASTPTTIGGYGITDFNSLGDARWSVLAHTHAFAAITAPPTTIGGYGITDFNSLGDARWNPLATGTPTGSKFLRDDNSWQTPPGGGTVTGSGTVGTLPKFGPLTNNLTDSIILEAAGVVTVAGAVRTTSYFSLKSDDTLFIDVPAASTMRFGADGASGQLEFRTNGNVRTTLGPAGVLTHAGEFKVTTTPVIRIIGGANPFLNLYDGTTDGYLQISSGKLGLTMGSKSLLLDTDGHFYPNTDAVQDLGLTTSKRFRHAYFSGSVVLDGAGAILFNSAQTIWAQVGSSTKLVFASDIASGSVVFRTVSAERWQVTSTGWLDNLAINGDGGFYPRTVVSLGGNLGSFNTVQANISGLLVPNGQVSITYEVWVDLAVTMTGTGGVKFYFTGPAGVTGEMLTDGTTTAITASSFEYAAALTVPAAFTFAKSATTHHIRIKATMRVAAGASANIQLVGITAAATTCVVLKGSSIMSWRSGT